MVFLQNAWWLLVLIGIMILIHELGHYWAARTFDVRVETFSFGFGPRLFGFRKGETDFRFSLILFGGYVKMAGEQPGEETSADPRGFLAKPRWQRMIIAFAGPFMNILLAVLVLTGLFMYRFPKLPNNASPAIGYIVPDSAAAKAGLKEGDHIVQIDNTVDPTWEDIIVKEAASAQHQLTVWITRDGERKRFTVEPVLEPKEGTGFVGWEPQTEVQIADVLPGMGASKVGLEPGDILRSVNGRPIRSTPTLLEVITANSGKPVQLEYARKGQVRTVEVQPSESTNDGQKKWMIGVQLKPTVVFTSLSFPDALRESVRQNAKTATLIYQVLHGIIERRMSPKSLQGPIGIARAAGASAREGATAFFGLMAMVSLNLAIFNLLPIPILDGGVILMLLVEMLMRRDLSLRVKETVFKLGFVFLMVVVAFALYNDISKLAG
jgi:regulator of sigma E protease